MLYEVGKKGFIKKILKLVFSGVCLFYWFVIFIVVDIAMTAEPFLTV